MFVNTLETFRDSKVLSLIGDDIDGLVQDCSNSIVNALEL